jgi:hypothetical protein
MFAGSFIDYSAAGVAAAQLAFGLLLLLGLIECRPWHA